jgi:hypothetical protein
MLRVWIAVLAVGCTDGGNKMDIGFTQPRDIGFKDAEPDDDDASTGDAFDPRCPDRITLTFTGTVVTVAGTPLGFDSTVRTSTVIGSFTWDLCVTDERPSDPERATYDHSGSGAFEMRVRDKLIEGSGWPVLEVENLASSDTFRFRDGPQFNDPTDRTLKVNGNLTPGLEQFFAITDDSATAFSSDGVPAIWPFNPVTDYPHTFFLEDDGGSLLMQLTTLTDQ